MTSLASPIDDFAENLVDFSKPKHRKRANNSEKNCFKFNQKADYLFCKEYHTEKIIINSSEVNR